MAKCYIICCAICGCLHETSRRDALTCSSKCRVSLHRHPEKLNKLRKQSETCDVKPFMVLQAQALHHLRPDLVPRIMSGEAKLDDLLPELLAAFNQRLLEAARFVSANQGETA
jgi:hypothetical protein